MKQTILSILTLCCWNIAALSQPSSFSLRNSHVTMPKGYNDFSLKNSGVVGSSNFGQYLDLGGGNWFKGSTSNGKPSHGTLHLSNGVEHKGAFNSNIQPIGIVLTTWPDGSWYYGNYVNGVRHGSGSMFVNGTYYDVEMDNNKIGSAETVSTPRYDKANFDGLVNAANNAYGESYDDSNSSGSSTRNNSNGKRVCPRCKGKKYIDKYVPSVSEYGLKKPQYYTCTTCGRRVAKNSGHGHSICPDCHGVGYIK